MKILLISNSTAPGEPYLDYPKYENNLLKLIGSRSARIFRKGTTPQELNAGDDFSFLFYR